ncbi:hypothetical protein [Litchfieldia salsa]|uniref:Uncharacterized protein n=1 Tax=Litchfieldia salsa TaxID=930152 RepID=A0A1H0RKV4_9BACI|nr:hypothetical protein [Litchfieldia salsa]SDP29558.1 hypothetical protein SAMN05216565_102242 [Litchfieldia salsa]
MKNYTVVIIQFIIWSIYSIVEWISQSDGYKSKMILLIIFSYFAFLTATKFGLTRKRAVITTLATISIFFIFQQLFWNIII